MEVDCGREEFCQRWRERGGALGVSSSAGVLFTCLAKAASVSNVTLTPAAASIKEMCFWLMPAAAARSLCVIPRVLLATTRLRENTLRSSLGTNSDSIVLWLVRLDAALLFGVVVTRPTLYVPAFLALPNERCRHNDWHIRQGDWYDAKVASPREQASCSVRRRDLRLSTSIFPSSFYQTVYLFATGTTWTNTVALKSGPKVTSNRSSPTKLGAGVYKISEA